MNIQLSRKELQAALICSAQKDVRYYLTGVCIEVANELEYSIVATDGHILFHAPCHKKDGDDIPNGPFELIIPNDTISLALKSTKSEILELVALDNGKYKLGIIEFAPIDGKFPDYRRVIPDSVSGEVAQFNTDLQARAQKALQTATDYKKHFPTLHHNGTSASVYTLGHYAVVIMPTRTDSPLSYSAPYIPKYQEKKAA